MKLIERFTENCWDEQAKQKPNNIVAIDTDFTNLSLEIKLKMLYIVAFALIFSSKA